MSEEEEKRLHDELESLKEQLEQQSQRIEALEARLQPGWAHRAPSSSSRSSFSLENFIGLRLIQFIGIIVLVIGLSIGVKYAIDRNLISPLLRIVLAYVAGLILYGLSVLLKKNFTIFSALLFSGGMASLYFTTYAAYTYYALFSFGFSFGLMALFTVYTVYEAVRYNRQEIALLGLVGAYSIPFLISKNSDRADLFFLYIGLINCGVVFLFVRKGWRMVGHIAQLLTWTLFLSWTTMRMQPASVFTGWVALVFFYLLFTVAIVACRVWNKEGWSNGDRRQLMMNNMVLFAGIDLLSQTESILVAPQAALVMAILTAAEAFAIQKQWKDEGGVARALAALSLFFFVLFIGMNWDGFTVTLLWLLTAVVVFAWGFVRHSVNARLLSMVLIGVTLGKLVLLDSRLFSTVEKVVAYLVLGVLLLVASFFYQKFKGRIFREEGQAE